MNAQVREKRTMTKGTSCRKNGNTTGGLVMSREKGTRNVPQAIIDEIVAKHKAGSSRRELAKEYGKPFKTVKNMITRENSKARRENFGLPKAKKRGRKPAVSLQEYKYENRRLEMENELLRDFLHLVGRK